MQLLMQKPILKHRSARDDQIGHLYRCGFFIGSIIAHDRVHILLSKGIMSR